MKKFGSRFLCPNCLGDLKLIKPGAFPRKWYKLSGRNTLKCPYCAAKLANRFASFDTGLVIVLMTGGLVSLWGVGKVMLPILLVVIAVRLLLGLLVSRYVLVNN
ncbi:MAG: hypothetical protein ACOH1I_09660 [Gallionellaceae bacterium]|jgi:hypothetical protein